jgi:hypothetical protein
LKRLAVRARAAPQRLAVHGQARDRREFLFQEPIADKAVELMRVQFAQHAIKGRVAGRRVVALAVALAAQRP